METAKRYSISYFHCPICRFQMTVPRKLCRKRKKGHIKDLYCPNCDKIVKMRENNFITLAEKEKTFTRLNNQGYN